MVAHGVRAITFTALWFSTQPRTMTIMAYDEKVASRVRTAMVRRRGVREQKMFGGIAFMVNDHMCCGVLDDNLVLRLGNEAVLKALNHDHTRPMDFTGKVLKSMIYIEPKGFAKDADLRKWLDQAVKFARAQPAKRKDI